MKIAVGCDEAALLLKEEILKHLQKKGIAAKNFGTYDAAPCLYPDIAVKVAGEVRAGNYQRGILLCGTGIGMAITANKVPGIRAAVCHDPFSAKRARGSNDAQILCMGARIIAPQLALVVLDTWLESEFEGGSSAEKVARIRYYEKVFQEDANNTEH